ncbi:uncharacterized protein LOC122506111 [Leptopilina heterotoma]|uniref:uncharacterized protein LOC122506111 n=1 Tax=Leptopilina heterotoma TaxID=63436 RepID=UPI001CA7EC15|nr:uncharacterized protein LOC122506111 [Leptopilina heterotoma]
MSQIEGIPAAELDEFLKFDNKLKTDEVLIINVKHMMTMYANKERMYNSFTSVIPKIMNKSVQLFYTAFGRETKGKIKLNFSATETYKCLKAVIEIQFPDKVTDISSVLSRWFSSASDREGGRSDRVKKSSSKSVEDQAP